MPDVTPGSPGSIVPVKDGVGKKLPLGIIRFAVGKLMDDARRNPNETYRVSSKGWGYKPSEIAPMFDRAPDNVSLPYEFQF